MQFNREKLRDGEFFEKFKLYVLQKTKCEVTNFG